MKDVILFTSIKTTGPNHSEHEIVDIACVNSNLEAVVNTRVWPAYPGDCTPDARNNGRFNEVEWEHSPLFDSKEVAGELYYALNGAKHIGGYRPHVAMAFIKEEWKVCTEWSSPTIDQFLDLYTLAVVTLMKEGCEVFTLAGICSFLKVKNTAPHTALGDALATARCWDAIHEGFL